MKDELEVSKQKIVSTLSEVPEGTDVWMVFPDLHKTKPLLVTRGKVAFEHGYTFLMEQIFIDIHDREGMEGLEPDGYGLFLKKSTHNPSFGHLHCYFTEEAAQKALDEYNARELERINKLRQMYKKVADVYMSEHGLLLLGDDLNTYLEGFIDCAMYLRDNKRLLDIQPNVPGMQKLRDFDDIKYGFE